ncbi:hypothetical protein quinque_005493 [Culex quinquefasciatus]
MFCCRFCEPRRPLCGVAQKLNPVVAYNLTSLAESGRRKSCPVDFLSDLCFDAANHNKLFPPPINNSGQFYSTTTKMFHFRNLKLGRPVVAVAPPK